MLREFNWKLVAKFIGIWTTCLGLRCTNTTVVSTIAWRSQARIQCVADVSSAGKRGFSKKMEKLQDKSFTAISTRCPSCNPRHNIRTCHSFRAFAFYTPTRITLANCDTQSLRKMSPGSRDCVMYGTEKWWRGGNVKILILTILWLIAEQDSSMMRVHLLSSFQQTTSNYFEG